MVGVLVLDNVRPGRHRATRDFVHISLKAGQLFDQPSVVIPSVLEHEFHQNLLPAPMLGIVFWVSGTPTAFALWVPQPVGGVLRLQVKGKYELYAHFKHNHELQNSTAVNRPFRIDENRDLASS